MVADRKIGEFFQILGSVLLLCGVLWDSIGSPPLVPFLILMAGSIALFLTGYTIFKKHRFAQPDITSQKKFKRMIILTTAGFLVCVLSFFLTTNGKIELPWSWVLTFHITIFFIFVYLLFWFIYKIRKQL